MATEVHGLGALCLRPLKCVRSPALGVEQAGKLTERGEKAYLCSGEDVHMGIACIFLRYLKQKSIDERETSLDRAAKLLKQKQLIVHFRTEF
jgi:hypothetical protein